MGRSLARKISSSFNSLDELAGIVRSPATATAPRFSEKELVRLKALVSLWGRGDPAGSRESAIYVDRLHKLAGPLGDVLLAEPDRETMACVYLGERNRLLRISKLAVGSRHDVIFEFRSIFVEALKCDAKSIMLAHSHVVSSYAPSPDDMETTRLAVLAGELVGIPVTDHIIMCPSDEEPGCWHFRSMRGLNVFPDALNSQAPALRP